MSGIFVIFGTAGNVIAAFETIVDAKMIENPTPHGWMDAPRRIAVIMPSEA